MVSAVVSAERREAFRIDTLNVFYPFLLVLSIMLLFDEDKEFKSFIY